jgi:phosphoglycolate phosphatase-like HAD superfamily hydrolase
MHHKNVDKQPCQLLITDIDNTLFDWISYYAHCYGGLIKHLSEKFVIPYDLLVAESAMVFESHGSIEYPFVVQELPSIAEKFKHSMDELLSQAVQPARQVFLEIAKSEMVPYPGVTETLRRFKEHGVKLVALTDAPRYVAMWKLNKLNLLHFYDAVYGLPDPKIPINSSGEAMVHPSILVKHLRGWDFGYSGHMRTLPEHYEKPDPKGLKTVLMDFGLDEPTIDRKSIYWVGDNPRKDVYMGHQLGLTTIWAQYGVRFDAQQKKIIDAFSSPRTLHRNASFAKTLQVEVTPDLTIQSFSELQKFF